MGICKYCKQEAGFFKDKHIECEQDYFKKVEEKKLLVENLINQFSDNEKIKLEEIYQETRKLVDMGNMSSPDFGKNPVTKITGENTLKEQLFKANNPHEYLSIFFDHLDKVTDFAAYEKIINTIENQEKFRYKDDEFFHFYYIKKIEFYYRNRDIVEGAFDKAIESCLNMIKVAKPYSKNNDKKDISGNPSHPGYKQLAIIYFKQGKYQEVIDLCKQAKSQYWKGDWDDRIEKAKTKLEKLKKD